MDSQDTSTKPKNIKDTLSNIAFVILCIYIFATPLLFTTLTPANIFDFPKWLLTVITAFILTIIVAIKFLVTREISLLPNKYLIPLVGIFLTFSASMMFSQAHKLLPLTGKGGLVLAMVIILSCAINLIKEKAKYLVYPLLTSTLLLSSAQILGFFEITRKISNSTFLTNKTFTPAGSQTGLATILAATAIISIFLGTKAKNLSQKVIYFLLAGIQSTALVFSIALQLPQQPASVTFLPFNHGWSIAVDQLKNWTTALFGVGPDSFSIAFTAFRPAALNNGDNWFLRYSTSSNEFLTLFTTVGALGLIAFTLLAILLVRQTVISFSRSANSSAAGVALVAVIISMLLMPSNFMTIFLIFTLPIILWGSDHEKLIRFRSDKLAYILGVILSILPIFGAFLSINAARAEAYFGRSLQFAAENRGTDTYNSQIQAIELNPYMYRYRIAYSNTNLALANSIASKEDITDEDRQNITLLIGQSIREAKAAIALNPLNSSAWVNLAQIYRQLINFAQGSDQWATSSYIQAIRLDKTNPQLRLDFGGLLFSLGRYDDAIDQYKQAISLKPNMANAYYNLSYAYRQLERYPESYQVMQNVLSLVDPASVDYDQVVEELKQLEALLPEPPQTSGQPTRANDQEGELKLPQPTPIPGTVEEVQFSPQEQQELEPPLPQKPLEENEEEVPESTESAQVESAQSEPDTDGE